ncbi:MAG TPA: putative ABC exporter domain-containing protein, partial [Fimbriimonas sp.]
MRPLVFLTIRSFVNGVKRSLSSIRRLIGLIFFVGYYAWLVLRPVGGRREGFEHVPDLPVGFQAPPLEALDGVVFGLFSLLSFVLVMNVMGYRGGFKPADVDVLFPTPINPRVVLVFRIVRDYLITLLLPLFFAIVGWQGVSQGVSLFRNRFTEQQVAMTFRAVAVAWILMALCWVSIGYAASLFVNRSDLQSDRNKRIIGYTIAALLLLVATYIGLAVRQDPSWETARELAAS